ncbi:coiled-coil domain-containing protein [Lysinibacillus xylanilyticus]|uniref:hypothetical protein n=1 Tax=Lysinibacillus xylanilyticus TaxID=582475 RepID=UPI003801CC90
MYSGNQASYDNLSENMKQKLEELKTSIVNDLTTGGSDKALSAESGKELKSLVDEKADGEDLESLQTEITKHLGDNTSHTEWIETVGGTANALTATLEGLTSYKNGLGVSFPVKSNGTAAMSLNINGLGAIPIKKANGTAFSNGKAGGVYTVRYRDGAFILQGESEVEVGKQIITPNTVNQAITAGVHDGTGYVVGSPNLIPANIKRGVSMFGVTGTYGGDMAEFGVSYLTPFTSAPKGSAFHIIDMTGYRVAMFMPYMGSIGERDLMNGGITNTLSRRRIGNDPGYGTDATLTMVFTTDKGLYNYVFPKARGTVYMPPFTVVLSGTTIYLQTWYTYDHPDAGQQYGAKNNAVAVNTTVAYSINELYAISFKIDFTETQTVGVSSAVDGAVYKFK